MLFLSITTTVALVLVLLLIAVAVKAVAKQGALTRSFMNTMFMLTSPMVLSIITIWILYFNIV